MTTKTPFVVIIGMAKKIDKFSQTLEQFGLSQAIYSRGVFYYRKQTNY